MRMYEARQNKATAPHIISKQPTEPLKSINDYRRNNLLQLMKLKELPLNKITLYIPLLWDQSKFDRFLQHYAEEEILDFKKISELINRFEESGVIQEGLKDLAKESKDFDEENIPQYDGPEIPMIIHRFWSGGPMNDEVVSRLLFEKKRNPQIDMILWYSKKLEDKFNITEDDKTKREQQRKQLGSSGFRVKTMEELLELFKYETDDPHVSDDTWNEFTDEAAKNKEKIAFLSDISRLMYLYIYGGHHMDIDVGMGKMFQNRKHPYQHGSVEHPDTPLLGGLLRDSDTQIGKDKKVVDVLELVQENFDSIFEDKINPSFKELLEHAANSVSFNSLIATHDKNPLFRQAINHFIKESTLIKEMVSGMNVIRDYLPNDQTLYPLIIPEYLFDLKHYTEESDNRYDNKPF